MINDNNASLITLQDVINEVQAGHYKIKEDRKLPVRKTNNVYCNHQARQEQELYNSLKESSTFLIWERCLETISLSADNESAWKLLEALLQTTNSSTANGEIALALRFVAEIRDTTGTTIDARFVYQDIINKEGINFKVKLLALSTKQLRNLLTGCRQLLLEVLLCENGESFLPKVYQFATSTGSRTPQITEKQVCTCVLSMQCLFIKKLNMLVLFF